MILRMGRGYPTPPRTGKAEVAKRRPERAIPSRVVYLMGLFFLTAGITHFTTPGFFRQLVPPMLPAPGLLVALSGAAEIALGIGVMIPTTRRLAAWGLIALLVAVYPANVYQAAVNPTLVDPPAWMGQPSQAALYVRLPLQFVLMYWAWRYTR
jgi:uncharacterized membrane protein